MVWFTRKMHTALESEDFLAATSHKAEIAACKKKLREQAVCFVCWMPAPSPHALNYVPEKWYMDEASIKCAYCGKDCIVPAPDGNVADHQALIVQSLKDRIFKSFA